MEDVNGVEERQKDYLCKSSTISLKPVYQEFINSMLEGHRFPSIPNEDHHSKTSRRNTEKETVVV